MKDVAHTDYPEVPKTGIADAKYLEESVMSEACSLCSVLKW